MKGKVNWHLCYLLTRNHYCEVTVQFSLCLFPMDKSLRHRRENANFYHVMKMRLKLALSSSDKAVRHRKENSILGSYPDCKKPNNWFLKSKKFVYNTKARFFTCGAKRHGGLVQGVSRLLSILILPFSRTCVEAACCPFMCSMGIVAN